MAVGKMVLEEVPYREIARRLGIGASTVGRIYRELHEEDEERAEEEGRPNRYPLPEERKKHGERHDRKRGRESVGLDKDGNEVVRMKQSRRMVNMDPRKLDDMRG